MTDLLAEGAAANERYVKDMRTLDLAFLIDRYFQPEESEFEAAIKSMFTKERYDDGGIKSGSGGDGGTET